MSVVCPDVFWQDQDVPIYMFFPLKNNNNVSVSIFVVMLIPVFVLELLTMKLKPILKRYASCEKVKIIPTVPTLPFPNISIPSFHPPVIAELGQYYNSLQTIASFEGFKINGDVGSISTEYGNE